MLPIVVIYVVLLVLLAGFVGRVFTTRPSVHSLGRLLAWAILLAIPLGGLAFVLNR